jgi:hypothetical protein
MSKHLAGIGQDGDLNERPLCGASGETVPNVSTASCKACLWTLYMVLTSQLHALTVKMREVDAITLRVTPRKAAGG